MWSYDVNSEVNYEVNYEVQTYLKKFKYRRFNSEFRYSGVFGVAESIGRVCFRCRLLQGDEIRG